MKWTWLSLIVVLVLLLSLGCCYTTPTGGGSGGSGGSVASVTYSLYTSVDGSGRVSPASGAFSSGEVVTLTAAPNNGWKFNYWSGDASGTSSTVTITMTSNRSVTAHFVPVNPSIRVILDTMQAIEDCEPFFMAPGDFYCVVVVTDGSTSSEVRIPSAGNYPLYDGDTANPNAVCYSTSEVGDYLEIVVACFEQDSGICYGEYVLGAVGLLGDELVPGLGTGATILLCLIDAQREDEGFWCDKDDFAGGFDQTWYKSQNWGIGSHCLEAPPYFRVWLTIEEL
ncbi:MAG: hypothetical protein WBC82_11205 [Dehalococcoidia bacterium]